MSVRPQSAGAPSRLTLPPDLSRLSEARAWAGEAGSRASLPEARIFDLQVTVSEATANAIEHAASAVELTAWLLPDRLIVEITNDGVFQPGLYKDDDRRRRGLGLPLIVSLADQVHVSRLPSHKTQVSLTFFAPAGGRREPADFSLTSRVANPSPLDEEHRPGRTARWVWLAIPLLVVAVAVLYATGVNSSRESPTLLTAFNTLFLTAALLIMAFLATRSYVRGGPRALRPLGWGASVLGLSYLLGGLLIGHPNSAVTVSNVGILAAGVCMALSAVWALSEEPEQPIPELWKVIVPYVGVAAFVGLLTATALTGVLPEFFIKGQGYTWWRDVTLGLGVIALLIAAAGFRVLYGRRPSRFLLWCFSGLGLIGVALGSVLLTEAVPGSTLAWLTRAGGWAGGVLLLVAVFSVERGGGAWVLPLQQALRETEDRYKNLVDLSPDAILVDMDGKHVFANAAAGRLFGAHSSGELIGRDALDGVYPDDRELVAQRIGQVVGGAVTPPREIRMLRLDGTPISVEVSASRVQFGGRLANQVVIRDIAERKQGERGIRDLSRRLTHHIERSPLAVIEWGPDMRLVRWSGEAERMFGWRADEVLGKRMEDFRWVYHEDTAHVEEVSTQLQDGTNPRRFSANRNYHKDGSVIDCEWYNSSLLDEEGGLQSILSLVLDVTARKRVEEALRQSEERYRILAEENERLYRQQLDIAENLQFALLNIPSELGPLRIGHLYRSATEAARIGGDFYDVFEVKDGKIAVLIGDVCGHGIEAARTATLVKDVVHAFTHQSLRTDEVLRRTNALLLEKNLPGFVTVFLGILDRNTGRFRYSLAGHPEGLLRTPSGEVKRLGLGAPPLGVYPNPPWKTHQVELGTGDILVLYTDGVIETRRDGEFFGEKRLENIVKRKRVSPERLPHLILDQVLAFSQGRLEDDVAVLALSLREVVGQASESAPR